jgi:hypothetical protein
MEGQSYNYDFVSFKATPRIEFKIGKIEIIRYHTGKGIIELLVRWRA